MTKSEMTYARNELLRNPEQLGTQKKEMDVAMLKQWRCHAEAGCAFRGFEVVRLLDEIAKLQTEIELLRNPEQLEKNERDDHAES